MESVNSVRYLYLRIQFIVQAVFTVCNRCTSVTYIMGYYGAIRIFYMFTQYKSICCKYIFFCVCHFNLFSILFHAPVFSDAPDFVVRGQPLEYNSSNPFRARLVPIWASAPIIRACLRQLFRACTRPVDASHKAPSIAGRMSLNQNLCYK